MCTYIYIEKKKEKRRRKREAIEIDLALLPGDVPCCSWWQLVVLRVSGLFFETVIICDGKFDCTVAQLPVTVDAVVVVVVTVAHTPSCGDKRLKRWSFRHVVSPSSLHDFSVKINSRIHFPSKIN